MSLFSSARYSFTNKLEGKGGDGCVAFNREKYKPYGPPSGGNGGKGSDIYILPTTDLTTLSSIPKRVKGAPGGQGRGSWMNGRNARPTVLRVPVGTVVKEVTGNTSQQLQDEWQMEEEGLKTLTSSDRIARLRDKRWVHYPGSMDDNLQRDAFQEAEKALFREERNKRILQRQQQKGPLFLDLDSTIETSEPIFDSSGLRQEAIPDLGYLIASGGEGGLGNPAFLTADNRSPKFATRGSDGQTLTVSLELKILADIGLVGYPNAGKSTLLRALTGGRAKTEVAGYAFTTLNPIVGVVRVNNDGEILGGEGNDVFDETRREQQHFNEMMDRGELAEVQTRNQKWSGSAMDIDESYRFTVADNPGLISQASENVGLGHSFLRAIERSLALVYVVDLSAPSPEKDLMVLREELEAYKPGLSQKARLVIANKADLLGSDGDASVEEAKSKLMNLENFVRTEMTGLPSSDHSQQDQSFDELDIVAVSAKYNQNLRKVVRLMQNYIADAKIDAKHHKHVLPALS